MYAKAMSAVVWMLTPESVAYHDILLHQFIENPELKNHVILFALE